MPIGISAFGIFLQGTAPAAEMGFAGFHIDHHAVGINKPAIVRAKNTLAGADGFPAVFTDRCGPVGIDKPASGKGPVFSLNNAEQAGQMIR